jgi:hypothetical protein
VFVGDAMEDLPTFTPANLACRYFCFGKGTTPGATFHEIARLTGAPHCRFDPGSARQLASPAGGSLGMGWRAQALLASGNEVAGAAQVAISRPCGP